MRPELEVVSFVEHPDEHFWVLVKKLCESYWYEMSVEQYFREWFAGSIWFWKVGDDAIILTRTVKRGCKEFLWIEGIAGSGMIAKHKAIVRDLKVIAKEYNCAGILGNALRPGLMRLYESFGSKRVSVQYLLEVD